MPFRARTCSAGADELGLPLDEHIGHVIAALREAAEPLGLKGTL